MDFPPSGLSVTFSEFKKRSIALRNWVRLPLVCSSMSNFTVLTNSNSASWSSPATPDKTTCSTSMLIMLMQIIDADGFRLLTPFVDLKCESISLLSPLLELYLKWISQNIKRSFRYFSTIYIFQLHILKTLLIYKTTNHKFLLACVLSLGVSATELKACCATKDPYSRTLGRDYKPIRWTLVDSMQRQWLKTTCQKCWLTNLTQRQKCRPTGSRYTLSWMSKQDGHCEPVGRLDGN